MRCRFPPPPDGLKLAGNRPNPAPELAPGPPPALYPGRAVEVFMPVPERLARFLRIVRVKRVVSLLPLLPSLSRLAVAADYQPLALAGLCGMKLRTLERQSRECFGLTPLQWLNALRQRQAEQLALAGRRAKEIQDELCYKHLSHFSRQFKKAHRVSLRSWKKSAPPYGG